MIGRRMRYSALAALSLASAAGAQDRTVLPAPEQPFAGTIGETWKNSKPAMPKRVQAPAGAPNVLLILTDDVGFAAASTFGGPVPTPNLDRLARRGLLYNRFHTTAMCSPTRAALLTGRNHHAVSTGLITDLTTGYPGYWAEMPRSAATVAEVLRLNGWNTGFFGKHHNVPGGQTSAAGPFDLWPTGLGFEYFYGFIGGDTNQWRPNLYRGISPVERRHHPETTLDADLATDLIHWLHNQQAAAPDKPFFAYLAPGSAHAPHQAPADWIAKFKGRFDAGWDALREQSVARQKALRLVPADTMLTPRPAAIPAWDALSDDERRVHARMMEVFAGMLAYQDAEIGRVLDELDRMGESDNTLVLFIEGDNGASAEGGPAGDSNEIGKLANNVPEDTGWLLRAMPDMGGPDSYQIFSAGWAWATNAPFPWTKQVASHLGGIRNGLVVSWPKGIAARGTRSQFTHVTDIMPTILEAAGLPLPTRVNGADQQRVDGVSMVYSFADAAAPERHRTQYFELLGNRGIYADGWFANTTPKRAPWDPRPVEGLPTDYDWELYDLRTDFSQSRNVAAVNPAKLAELQTLWKREAQANKVLPLDDRFGMARVMAGGIPPMRGKSVFWGAGISVAQAVAPPINVRSFSITADIVVPKAGGEGAVVASGSRFGGWSFFLDRGRPVAVHAFSQQPQHQYRIAAKDRLPAGPVQLRFDFDYARGPGQGGTLRISANGREMASGTVDRTILVAAGLGETFDIGRDTGAPVIDYRRSDVFNGTISKVEVQLR